MTTTETSPQLERTQPRTVPARRRLGRAPYVLRTEGMRSVLARLLGNLVYRRVVVMASDLSGPPREVECELQLEIRELTPEEVDAYVSFWPRADAETACRRLDAGSRCYIAWHDGRIVCAGWTDVGLANFDALGAVLPIGPRDVYARDAYTVPELRGRNIATYRMVAAIQQLRTEGFERGIGYVLPQNHRAFRPPTKAGAHRLGSLGWFGVGPLRVYFYKRVGAGTRFLPRYKRRQRPVELDLELS